MTTATKKSDENILETAQRLITGQREARANAQRLEGQIQAIQSQLEELGVDLSIPPQELLRQLETELKNAGTELEQHIQEVSAYL